MDVSVALLKFWGLYLTIFGIILLINKNFVPKLMDFARDEKFYMLTGVLALFIGLIHVVIHNIFVWDWRLIITLLGYIALIRGVVRLSFPERSMAMIGKMDKMPFTLLTIVVLLAGLALLFLYYRVA